MQAKSISRGDEDAHFVKPKPSYALMLKNADLFVTTGLDLELWAPVLVDKSGNSQDPRRPARLRQRQPGRAAARRCPRTRAAPRATSTSTATRTSSRARSTPRSSRRNIAAGLKRVDPANAAAYDQNLKAFQNRIDRLLYGDQLPQILGAQTLDNLARQGKLIPFLQSKDYKGKKLIDLLGGWLEKGMAFRGQKIVTYHKNWTYFTDLFGLAGGGRRGAQAGHSAVGQARARPDRER